MQLQGFGSKYFGGWLELFPLVQISEKKVLHKPGPKISYGGGLWYLLTFHLILDVWYDG